MYACYFSFKFLWSRRLNFPWEMKIIHNWLLKNKKDFKYGKSSGVLFQERTVKMQLKLLHYLQSLVKEFSLGCNVITFLCNSNAVTRASRFFGVFTTFFGFFQVGLSRSTTGCVSACLFREFQLHASFEGLIETVPGVNLDLLRMDKYELEKDKDALFRGEFEVVKELLAALGDNGDVSDLRLHFVSRTISFLGDFFWKILTFLFLSFRLLSVSATRSLTRTVPLPKVIIVLLNHLLCLLILKEEVIISCIRCSN